MFSFDYTWIFGEKYFFINIEPAYLKYVQTTKYVVKIFELDLNQCKLDI